MGPLTALWVPISPMASQQPYKHPGSSKPRETPQQSAELSPIAPYKPCVLPALQSEGADPPCPTASPPPLPPSPTGAQHSPVPPLHVLWVPALLWGECGGGTPPCPHIPPCLHVPMLSTSPSVLTPPPHPPSQPPHCPSVSPHPPTSAVTISPHPPAPHIYHIYSRPHPCPPLCLQTPTFSIPVMTP